jgi:hypothetical protein
MRVDARPQQVGRCAAATSGTRLPRPPFERQNKNGRNVMYIGLGGIIILILILWLLGVI